ncbi:glycosyltransferase [Conexibacter sp. DBS9H8]|uniref:glycosyltransferase n=1 Tax=Conexibacter sp. DBS9H8 TaxID=2937801 RepID=UPI00200BCD73|nr:glycosyltransferase [Conexibacter sp. DBS9H8]
MNGPGAGVDVLILSLGTTRGLRVADGELAAMLASAGARVRVCGVRIGMTGRLRRGYPVNDIVEALAARRAVGAGLARHRPRAVIFSTTTASLLAPSAPGRNDAVWLDSPARLNRPGARNRVLHRLEASRLARASVVLPWSPPAAEALPRGVRRAIVIPPPVRMGPAPTPFREPLVVAYVPDPKAKGLTLLCRAWQAYLEREGELTPDCAGPSGSADSPQPAGRLEPARPLGAPGSAAGPGGPSRPRLLVTGIEPGWAREFLRRAGIITLPLRCELLGMIEPDRFRALLARAQVFLSAAAWEDFGQAPLEALAAGARLVAAPAGGPFPALALARSLAADHVATDRSPAALARALAAGLQAPESSEYQLAARQALALYDRERTIAALADQVLPILLRDCDRP